MRYILALLLLISIISCTDKITYTSKINQGNSLDKFRVNQLKIGMTKQEVVKLLGAPIIVDIFHDNQWDYVNYSTDIKYRLRIIFKNNKVSKIDSINLNELKELNSKQKILEQKRLAKEQELLAQKLAKSQKLKKQELLRQNLLKHKKILEKKLQEKELQAKKLQAKKLQAKKLQAKKLLLQKLKTQPTIEKFTNSNKLNSTSDSRIIIDVKGQFNNPSDKIIIKK